MEYVYQEIDDRLLNRIKPLGTAHAILSTKNYINEPFVVVNSDDFYGYNCLKRIYDYLKYNDGNEHIIMCYKIENTLNSNKEVSRGICQIENDYLIKIEEVTKIRKENKEIISTKGLLNNKLVSTNLFGFRPSIYEYIEEEYEKFILNIEDDLNSEFYIPTTINNLLAENKIKVKVMTTDSKILGITYKEDKIKIEEEMRKL